MKRVIPILLCIVTLCGLSAKPKKLKKGETYSISDQSVSKYEEPGIAILEGDVSKLSSLLNTGVSPHKKQGSGISLLGIAIQTGNAKIVKMILEHPKFSNINERFTVVTSVAPVYISMQSSAIVEAIKTGNPEMIAMIMDENPSVEEVYEEHVLVEGRKEIDMIYTPLILAMNELNSYDGRAKKTTKNYKLADYAEQVQRIADATKNVNLVIPENQNASGPGNKPYANKLPNVAQLKSLLMYITPSVDAKRGLNTYSNKVVMSIIDRGANVNYSYTVDFTAYNKAVAKQYGAMLDPQVAKQLAAINKTTIAKQTIYASHIQKNAELLEYALEHGATVAHNGDKSATFFCSLTDLATIKMLVKRGMDINTLNPLNGFPLLFTIIGIPDTEMLEGVLRMGADMELLNKNGCSVEKCLQGMRPRDRKKQRKVIEKY